MKIVTLMHDNSPTDPHESDLQWRLYSFGRNHVHHKDPSNFFPLSIGLRRKLECGTAFLLSYHKHGSCRWYLRGDGRAVGLDHWDTVDVAGVLVWEHDVGELAKTKEERRKDAELFLETYTCWCNGEVYGYSVDELVSLPCGHTERKLLDSCFGFYGNDMEYMASLVADLVQGDEVQFDGEARDLAGYHDFIGKTKPVTPPESAPSVRCCEA